MRRPVVVASLFFLISCLLSENTSASANHLVISEIQTGSTASTQDEFVELYNPSSENISLTGWKLVKKTASPESQEIVLIDLLSGTVPANGYFLLAGPAYDGSAAADIVYLGTTIAANNTIILYNNLNEIADKAGYGTAADKEEAGAPDPGTSRSLERKAYAGSTAESMNPGGADENAGNGNDTDNNLADFILREDPQPQNYYSATEKPALPSQSPTTDPAQSAEPTATSKPTDAPTPTPKPDLTLTPVPTTDPAATPSATPWVTITPETSASASPAAKPPIIGPAFPKFPKIIRFGNNPRALSVGFYWHVQN